MAELEYNYKMKNNVLSWSGNDSSGYIIKNKNQKVIHKKPDLGFDYHSLLFFENNCFYKDVPDRIELTETEKNACIEFIKDFSQSNVKKLKTVYGVGNKNEFLGVGSPSDFNRYAVTSPGPGQSWYCFTTKKWLPCHGVDNEGKYLGRISPLKCYKIVPSKPPAEEYAWDFKNNLWVIGYDLPTYKKFVMAKVLNKITEIQNVLSFPTNAQLYVYNEKLRQARIIEKYKNSKTYPAGCDMLEFESKIKRKTIKVVAENIIKKHTDMHYILMKLEEFRLKAKKQIDKAKNNREADSMAKELIDNIGEGIK